MKPAIRGFLPDFSRYLFSDYPLEAAYRNSDLINKLGFMLQKLLTIQNPASGLTKEGCCKKLEKFTPNNKHERRFIAKCQFIEGQLYYAAFGNNPYRIVFGLDSNQRIVYFFCAGH